MSILLTQARPYAKAIFSLALEHDQLSQWQDTLKMLAVITIECKINHLLDSPKITATEKIDFFADVIKQAPDIIGNLVKLLVERKKLFLLPDIAESYRKLLLAYNKILEVKIISAYELSLNQKEQLIKGVKERYQSDILLQCHTDATLIGGAVLYIEDRVIDGSIIGMLQRLKKRIYLA